MDSRFDGNQRALATEADVSPQAVHTYLNRGRIPKAEELYRLSRALGVTMEYLLTGENLTPGLTMKPAPKIEIADIREHVKAAQNSMAAADDALKKFVR